MSIAPSRAMSSSAWPTTNHNRPAPSSPATTESTVPKRFCVRGNASLVQSGGCATPSSHIDPINPRVRGSPRMSSSQLHNAMISKGLPSTPPAILLLSGGIGIKLDEQTAASNSPQLATSDQMPSNVIIETVQYEDYIKQKDGHDETNDNEGMIDIEQDDDSDSVQWIEHDHELCALAKKATIGPTQANSAQAELIDQSPSQPTGEAQPNQMNKQIITVHLHCLQSDCPDTFPEDQLNLHMWEKHSIHPNRCLVKDCKQSFNNNVILAQHLKVVHSDIAEWNCAKCSKHYIKYRVLSDHNIKQHQLGHFQCSFPSCTFTGKYRMKVYNHYRQHKDNNPDFVCHQSGCHFRTKNSTQLKAHERSHLGIKPYHCKWPNCHYSSASQDTTMKHIQRTHFKPKTSSSPDLSHLGKPKDYIEVVR